MPESSKRLSQLTVALVAASVLLRIVLVPFFGFKDDLNAYEIWTKALAAHGPAHIYDRSVFPAVDYPPGYLYVLWAVGSLREALGATSLVAFRILLKIPDVVADLVLGALTFVLARRWLDRSRALAVTAIMLLAPVAWLDSAFWGQSDVIPAALVFGTVLLALERRFFWSWFLLALALLIKPQGILIVPLLLLWHAARGGRLGSLAGAALAGTTVAYLITLPFTTARAPFAVLRFLFDRYTVGVEKIPFTSEGAFNVYTITRGIYQSDASLAFGIPLHTWSLLFVGAALAAIAIAFGLALRSGVAGAPAERLLVYAVSLTFAAFFVFGSRMHERYLLPSLAFGTLLAFDGALPALAVGTLTFSFAVNCAFILKGFTTGAHHPQTLVAAHAFALLNLVVLAVWAEGYRRRCLARA